MNSVSLGLAFLRDRPWNAALTLALMAIGAAMVTLILIADRAVTERLERDLNRVDLVVGAKGSPLQLILSAVFQADAPAGNIPRVEAEAIASHPLVRAAAPLALGDSAFGARIVGTTPAYLDLFGAALAEGRLWAAPMEAVIGADIAAARGLRPGARFVATHGIGEGGAEHTHAPYTVVGILAPSGTVADRVILTSLESVWDVHRAEGYDPSQQVTALLVAYRSPFAAVQLPRLVNARDALMAAVPAIEAQRLQALFSAGTDVAAAFAMILIAASAFAAFAALMSAMRERMADVAVMRVLGATRLRVFLQLAGEAGALGAGGAAAGVLIGHLAAEAVGIALRASEGLPLSNLGFSPESLLIVPAAAVIGVLAGFVPALQAYRADVAAALAAR